MKRRIAFFDFDGTITTKDTLLELIKFQKGKIYFYVGFLMNAPILIAYKIGLVTNHRAKQVILRFFFRHMSCSEFQKECDRFGSSVLPGLVRPKALAEINRLLGKGIEVVIVSASVDTWIRGWCQTVGVQWITTLLEEKDGMITGRIKGKNCHGEEKVHRIKLLYELSGYEEIYCYGDTKGDKPMLAIGTRSFYKPFR